MGRLWNSGIHNETFELLLAGLSSASMPITHLHLEDNVVPEGKVFDAENYAKLVNFPDLAQPRPATQSALELPGQETQVQAPEP